MQHKKDRISELPDNVLLHIMNFMDTKLAVQTCVLSKRWKDLSKRLTNLTFYSNLPSQCMVEKSFKIFVSWVLSSRDHSYYLIDLTIESWIKAEALRKVIEYAVFHNVQKLKINISSSYRPIHESLPSIFCCKSLTSLELSNKLSPSAIILPKSMYLPALKCLHLSYVTFTATGSDCADPFSTFPVLETLVLRNYSVINLKKQLAQVLFITNSTLSSLTIFEGTACKIVLSTPNLSSFTITGSVGHELSSTGDLSFLN